MKQPAGTVTYKGHRKTVEGQESFGPDKVLKAASELYEAGKKIEAGEKPATETKTESKGNPTLYGE